MDKVVLPTETELDQLLKDKWTDELIKEYVKVEGCTLPARYLEMKKEIDEFEVFDSDIWVCSFPKTGTTWMSEMVWLIMNNFNFEKANTFSMFERIRFIDLSVLYNFGENPDPEIPECFTNSINFAKNQPHPRIIKSHLPFKLLPKQIQNGQKKPKIVYIIRNPLDTCVSFYYHSASMNYYGNLEEFCQLFVTGKMIYGDYWDNFFQFWKIRNQDNVLFLKYEDMKRDLEAVIKTTATFLGKSISDQEMQQLQNHLSFESMKKSSAINGCIEFKIAKKFGKIKSDHIRAGVVGGYKKEMPQKYVELFQNWTKNKLEGTEFEF